MTAFAAAASSYERLSKAFKAKDMETCGDLLTDLKMQLTELQFMPTGVAAGGAGGGVPSEQELLLARNVLELGAQWAVEAGDVEAFERYVAQLKTYYFDYEGELPPSSYRHSLLGLNLLCLLSQNRVGEFHTEVERLADEDIAGSVYLKYPVALEQYLMEGAYNKVFLAKESVPAENYLVFVDVLVNTIREEIAKGLESAYTSLPVQAAAKLLFISEDDGTLSDLAEAREWVQEDNKFVFADTANAALANKAKPVDVNKIVQQTLGYARDLERIV